MACSSAQGVKEATTPAPTKAATTKETAKAKNAPEKPAVAKKESSGQNKAADTAEKESK